MQGILSGGACGKPESTRPNENHSSQFLTKYSHAGMQAQNCQHFSVFAEKLESSMRSWMWDMDTPEYRDLSDSTQMLFI